MPVRTLLPAVVLALAVSACAATGAGGFGDKTAELTAQCRDRGGVLVPSGQPATGRPETDNVCQIHGGASRLP
jgi:hypothetical protein